MAESEQPVYEDDGTMPFVEHLRELRTRLRNSVLALLGGFAIAYLYKEKLFALLLRPFVEVWAKQQSSSPEIGNPGIYFKSLVEPFWAYFSLSLWAGLFLASPLIFYQIWKFIAPGLYRNERQYGILFALFSAVFFCGGAVFCYQLVLPEIYSFLLGYATGNIGDIARQVAADSGQVGAVPLRPLPMMEDYLILARRLIFGFGLVFELPLLIMFLSLAGLVTHRSLWRFNRWWVVLSFILSAMLTPPEIFSQVMMAGPLIVLYNLSILIAYVITIRRERREAAWMHPEAGEIVADEPADSGKSEERRE